MWHAIGTTSLVIAILVKAPTHQSAKFVFTQFVDGTGDPGWGSRASHAYVAVIGILLAQYTLTGRCLAINTASLTHTTTLGFDASAHVRAAYQDSLIILLIFSVLFR